jgi:hypothetical protein
VCAEIVDTVDIDKTSKGTGESVVLSTRTAVLPDQGPFVNGDMKMTEMPLPVCRCAGLEVLQAIYDSEISVEISWIYDGGVDVRLYGLPGSDEVLAI